MASVSSRYGSGQAFERPSGRAGAEKLGPVVLMVSGGADSTALLVLAATGELDIDDGRGRARIARERLHVLHVNHQLRGVDADADERFVCELSESLGVPVTVRRVDVAALAASAEWGDSNVENVAREVRYAAANHLANELCAEAGLPRSSARIVTAHTANDRTETFFMHAIKGSGTQGLSSIPRRRNRIVRPLLGMTHEQLCDLLRMRGIEWHEDATNADTHYLRNFVRHEIVPLARQRNPRLFESMASTCEILRTRTPISPRWPRVPTAPSSGAARTAWLPSTPRASPRPTWRLRAGSCGWRSRRRARVPHRGGSRGARAADRCRWQGVSHVAERVDVRVSYGGLSIRAREAQGLGETSGWAEVPALAGVAGKSATIAAPGQVGELDLAAGTLSARRRELTVGSDSVAVARAHAREWEGFSVLLDAAACGVGQLGGRLWV